MVKKQYEEQYLEELEARIDSLVVIIAEAIDRLGKIEIRENIGLEIPDFIEPEIDKAEDSFLDAIKKLGETQLYLDRAIEEIRSVRYSKGMEKENKKKKNTDNVIWSEEETLPVNMRIAPLTSPYIKIDELEEELQKIKKLVKKDEEGAGSNNN